MRGSPTKFRMDVSDVPDGCGVYRIVSTITGDSYIGGSENIRQRVQTHFNGLAHDTHYSPSFQQAFWDNGWRSFKVELVEACQPSRLNEREAYWIVQLAPAYNKRKDASVNRSRPSKGFVSVTLRQERRRRRQQIAEAIQDGRSRLEVASEFNVSDTIIKKACEKHGVKFPRLASKGGSTLTHPERRERRRQVAQAVSDGLSLVEACRQFSLGPASVRLACREFGVKCPSRRCAVA